MNGYKEYLHPIFNKEWSQHLNLSDTGSSYQKSKLSQDYNALFMQQYILVEEDSGAHNEFEDVFQRLHGPQQLFCKFLCIVHIVLQNFGQFPANTIAAESVQPGTSFGFKCPGATCIWRNSRVCQCGTEMLANIGLKNRVKVLELSVSNESNYEHLSENKDTY